VQHEQVGRLLRQRHDGELLLNISTLKSECATGVFDSRAEARLSIFEYIELCYHRQRRHSALGYQNPEAFEQAQAHQANIRLSGYSLTPLNQGKPTVFVPTIRVMPCNLCLRLP
jgi:hypothetical protein